jgi:hypothetical protein
MRSSTAPASSFAEGESRASARTASRSCDLNCENFARLDAGLFHIDRAELGELADDLGDAGLVR